LLFRSASLAPARKALDNVVDPVVGNHELSLGRARSSHNDRRLHARLEQANNNVDEMRRNFGTRHF
jgi:hypothetical protein